jgi:hypothetical protein
MIDFLIEMSKPVDQSTRRPSALGLRLTPDSTIETTSPPWLRAIEKRVNVLLNLHDNWDGEGAPRISYECVMAAFGLVLTNVTHETPAPHFVPTSQGGIQAEWHLGGTDLELIFDPTEPARYYYAGLDGVEIEGLVGDDPSLVRALMRALPTRNDIAQPTR